MKLSVVLEQRFWVTPDGRAWTGDAFAYAFWTRYLTAFDEVTVVARATPTATPPLGAAEVGGPNVRLASIPPYLGPRELVMRLYSVIVRLRRILSETDALLLRTPGTLSNLTFALLARRPFGVEVVGDPQEVFASGVVNHPLRVVWRAWFTRSLRHQCQAAAVACYVTERTLQRRYPPAVDAYTTWYSNVDLPDDAFAARPIAPLSGDPFRLVTVGSLDQLYKGVDTVLTAVASCRAMGLNVTLTVVGDGRYRKTLEAKARGLGLGMQAGETVTFAGRLPGPAAVRDELQRADVFVLASRTEGLPRVVIEAMAQGLPCISTVVGGIPEILPPDALVPPGDADALAIRLVALLRDPTRLAQMGARNLVAARAFASEALETRWRPAYRHLADLTARWQEDSC